MTDIKMPERIRMSRDLIKGFIAVMSSGTEYIRIDKYEDLEEQNSILRQELLVIQETVHNSLKHVGLAS